MDADAQTNAGSSRILSIDQFRGCAVFSMFAVNFLQGMESVPRLFQHNENWVSLADWIMPAFLFLVGMAFRLTWGKRIERLGQRQAVLGYVKRAFGLVAISLIAFGFGAKFGSWDEWNTGSLREFFAALLKARLWEVLAIIAASQLLILPVIWRSTSFRFCAILVLLLCHLAVSAVFNVHFVLAQPSVLDAYWGAADVRAWDGGFFGVLNWAAITLAGTIVMDWMTTLSSPATLRQVILGGVIAMLLGYGASCLSTFYDVPADQVAPSTAVAPSPVFPPMFRGSISLAEPPFVPIPPPEQRQVSYWMMSKRLVSLPYVLFATGFTLILLAGFIVACDRLRWQLAVFRILGERALAAYVIHHLVLLSLKPLFPKDSPLWFALLGLAIFIVIIVLAMQAIRRALQNKNKD